MYTAPSGPGPCNKCPVPVELWCPALFFKKNGPFFLEYNEYYEYLNITLTNISIEWDHIIGQIFEQCEFRMYFWIQNLIFKKKTPFWLNMTNIWIWDFFSKLENKTPFPLYMMNIWIDWTSVWLNMMNIWIWDCIPNYLNMR